MNRLISLLFRIAVVSVITASFFLTSLTVTQQTKFVQERVEAVSQKSFLLTKVVTEKSVDNLIYLLNTATSNDVITIYINSPGGDVVAGMNVLKAMQTSKAKHIEAVVLGMAASMAEGIAMEADHITMRPGSSLMFHYGDINGKVLTVKDLNNKNLIIANYMVLIDGYMHKQDDRLLTSADWNEIHKGKELWVTADEFTSRGGDKLEGRIVSNEYIDSIISLLNSFEQRVFFTIDISTLQGSL